MKTSVKWALGLAAAAVPLFAAGSASADSVSYETFGTFGGTDVNSNAGGFSTTGNGAVSSVSNSAMSLQFVGEGTGTIGTSSTTGASFDLGTFTLNQISSSGASFGGTDTFTINLEQLTPSTGAASSIATLSGSITQTGSQALLLSFNPGSFTIGTERYILPSLVGVNAGTASVLSAGVIQQNAAPPTTPLPTSGMAGMGLLALLGISKLKRSKAVTA